MQLVCVIRKNHVQVGFVHNSGLRGLLHVCDHVSCCDAWHFFNSALLTHLKRIREFGISAAAAKLC